MCVSIHFENDKHSVLYVARHVTVERTGANIQTYIHRDWRGSG